MKFGKLIGPQFQSWKDINVTVIDRVPDDMLYLVDNYWYQFPPMNPLWHNILGFFITLTGIIALCGNFAVIFIFSTTKNLRTPSNLFVINLALSDFLMMFTMFPPMVINCYYETWILGPMMCSIYGLCGSIFGCGSIWSMMLITFDRYNVIVKGITGKKLTYSGAIIRITIIWLLSATWTSLPLFGWNRYVPEGNMSACGTDYLTKTWYSRSYILCYSIFVYFIPLFSTLYFYHAIIKAVTRHEKIMREQAKKMNVQSLRSNKEETERKIETKLAKIALITISLWFMAWTPYLLINYCGIFETMKLTPLATIWGSVFAKCNAIYNPVVYGISHPKYKIALYNRFPCLKCATEEDLSLELQSRKTQVQTLSA